MLLSATKSRKKQQTELVQSVIHAEEEKRRKERKIFHITSVPVLYRAAYEPSLYHGTSDEHEDRKYLRYGIIITNQDDKCISFSNTRKIPRVAILHI